MSVTQNLSEVLNNIRASEKAANREENSVKLLAVSKTKPVSDIIEAYNAGQRLFGENYAKECADKARELSEAGYKDIEWHFIGPIQSNKTRLIAESSSWAESIDRVHIAERLNNQRPDSMPPLNVCLQVNISQEEQKQGIEISQVLDLSNEIIKFPRLKLRGLMAIALNTDNREILLESFSKMNEMFRTLQQKYPDIDTLSLGMTHDMDEAIAAGSTEVRIGTAIFGARDYSKKASA